MKTVSTILDAIIILCILICFLSLLNASAPFFRPQIHPAESACPNMSGIINLDKIAMIESSGNPDAWNSRDDSIGLYQITPICLQDFNELHPQEQYSKQDLWDPEINERIARWMFEERLPQLIRHFKKPVTVRNLIIAYNAGIAYVASGEEIPMITEKYLRKYGI